MNEKVEVCYIVLYNWYSFGRTVFILHWYREILSDEVEQLCSFPLLAGCVWHQYFQGHQDVNLGYNL